jgi:hypothetical protein
MLLAKAEASILATVAAGHHRDYNLAIGTAG